MRVILSGQTNQKTSSALNLTIQKNGFCTDHSHSTRSRNETETEPRSILATIPGSPARTVIVSNPVPFLYSLTEVDAGDKTEVDTDDKILRQVQLFYRQSKGRWIIAGGNPQFIRGLDIRTLPFIEDPHYIHVFTSNRVNETIDEILAKPNVNSAEIRPFANILLALAKEGDKFPLNEFCEECMEPDQVKEQVFSSLSGSDGKFGATLPDGQAR